MGFFSNYAAGKYVKGSSEPSTVEQLLQAEQYPRKLQKTVAGSTLEYLLKGMKAIDIGPSESTISNAPFPQVPQDVQDLTQPDSRVAQMTSPEGLLRSAESGLGSGSILGMGKPVGNLLSRLLGRIPESAITEKGNVLLADLIKSGALTEEEVVSNAPKVGGRVRDYIKFMLAEGTPEKEVATKLTALYKNPELISPEHSVNKLISLIQESEPLNKEQAALYSTEKAKRAAEVSNIQQQGGGEAGYFRELSALKGPLPKAQWSTVRNKLEETDITNLFDMVKQNTVLRPLEKTSAQSGLIKLLGTGGSTIPTESEIKLLSEVFPPQFVETMLSKRPLVQKLWEGTQEVINTPRAIMATMDLSAPLRQGIVLSAGHPIKGYHAFKEMFKYAFKEEAYTGWLNQTKADPMYSLARSGGLELTDMGPIMSSHEEKFLSRLPEHLPLLGRLVKGSNRAYSGFLNKLRFDVFKGLIKDAGTAGIDVSESSPTVKNIASLVNISSGRGDLGSLARLAPTLNAVFFSPRLMASRLQLLNPVTYIKMDPFTRKEAMKNMVSFLAFGTTVLSLGKLAGADVTLDYRNPDFGKIRIGNTRLDVWGGFQQYIRFLLTIASGQQASASTGVVHKVGEGYPPLSRWDIAGSFISSKEAPVPSFIQSALKGRSAIGKEFKLGPEIASRFIPMAIQDMSDAMKDQGIIKGAALATPGIFGVGVQTYSPDASSTVKSAHSVERYMNTLKKQHKMEEYINIKTHNEDTLKMAHFLSPTESRINELTKRKINIQANEAIPDERKSAIIAHMDKTVELLSAKRDSAFNKLKKNQKAGK